MLEEFPLFIVLFFFKWAFVREVNVLCNHVCCIVFLFVLLKSMSVRLTITNLHETSSQILEVAFADVFFSLLALSVNCT